MKISPFFIFTRWFKQLTKNLLKSIHFRNLFTVISFKENKKGDIDYEGLLIHW